MNQNAVTSREVFVDELSLKPLLIASFRDDEQLGLATAFIIQREKESFLITCRHVVAGSVDKGIPNFLKVKVRLLNTKDFYTIERLDLYDEDGKEKWLEHPVLGKECEVIAIPLSSMDIRLDSLNPLDLDLAKSEMDLMPSESVSVIGYPFGRSAGGLLPIWVNATIASDLAIDWSKLPAFLISGTTTPSMSGSMVIARRIGSMRLITGTNLFNGQTNDKFVGIYSGRLRVSKNEAISSHVGIVWRPEVIDKILDHYFLKP